MKIIRNICLKSHPTRLLPRSSSDGIDKAIYKRFVFIGPFSSEHKTFQVEVHVKFLPKLQSCVVTFEYFNYPCETPAARRRRLWLCGRTVVNTNLLSAHHAHKYNWPGAHKILYEVSYTGCISMLIFDNANQNVTLQEPEKLMPAIKVIYDTNVRYWGN